MTFQVTVMTAEQFAAAKRAREKMESLIRSEFLPLLRTVTRKPNLKVKVTGQEPQTDGETVWLQVPWKLGEALEHDMVLCREVDEDYLSLCPACRVADEVRTDLWHESAHITENTFQTLEGREVWKIIRRYFKEEVLDKLSDAEVRELRKRVYDAPSPLLSLSQIDSWIALTWNVVEDIYVNRRLHEARPGVELPMQATTKAAFVGETALTRGRDLTAAMVPYVIGHGIGDDTEVRNYFDPEFDPVFEDAEINDIVSAIPADCDLGFRVKLAVELLQRLRALGFMPRKSDSSLEEPPKPPPPPPPPSDDNESESGEGESDEDQEECDDSEPSDEAGEGDESEPQDGDGEVTDDEAQADDADDDAEPYSGDDDETGKPDEDDDDESEAESGDAGESEEADDESEDDESDSGESEASGADDADDDESEADEADDDESEAESGEAGESEEADDDESEADDDSGDGGSQADDDDGEADDESGEDDASGDGSESSDQDDDTDEADDESDDGASGDGSEADEDGESSDEADDGAPEDGGDEGEGTEDEGPTDQEIEEMILEAIEEMERTMGHQKQGNTAEQQDMIKQSIEQCDFDEPSESIHGLKTITAEEWHTMTGGGAICSLKPDEVMMAKPLNHLRVVFAENRETGLTRDLRQGRRLDTRHLHRAGAKDFRIFARKDIPRQRDWLVLLGVDFTSSNNGNGALSPVKEMAMTMGEMLSRLGIRFLVEAHTGAGDYDTGAFRLWCQHATLKGLHEPWTSESIERIQKMEGWGGNLDGHHLERYRKLIERERATDKLIIYVTDGELHGSGEEGEVLVRNINLCKRLGIHLASFSYRNKTPEDMGFDTVRFDGMHDLPEVIAKLDEILSQ